MMGRWVLFPVPPNPFPVPEAEPVACTTLTFPAPSSIPVLIPCLIAFLENRITLSKAKRIQAHTWQFWKLHFLTRVAGACPVRMSPVSDVLTDKPPEPCLQPGRGNRTREEKEGQ